MAVLKPGGLNRFLRLKTNHSRIFIWTEHLAKRRDMEEVYARDVEEAKNQAGIASEEGKAPDFVNMTKQQLVAYAKAHFDVKVNPVGKKHAALADEVKALYEKATVTPAQEGSDGDSGQHAN